MARETYRSLDSSIPAYRLAAVTPSDSTNIEICRGFYSGSGGSVRILGADDSAAVTLTNVIPGAIYAVQVKRFFATGTTATDLIALY